MTSADADLAAYRLVPMTFEHQRSTRPRDRTVGSASQWVRVLRRASLLRWTLDCR